MGGVSRAAPLEEITVYDNYMDQLSGVYEFSQKTAEYKKIQYPRSNSLFLLAKSAFLPEGYPKSVSKDYLEYQIWDTIQVCVCVSTINIRLLQVVSLELWPVKLSL